MRKILSRDGTPIAFDQSGQGPVLIAVGGATVTRLALASLAAGTRVPAPVKLPGVRCGMCVAG
jgi:hypothetical protein